MATNIIEITTTDVRPQLTALMAVDDPQASRSFNALAGNDPKGRIFTDDPQRPTWVAVQEGYDNVLFLGGAVDQTLAQALFSTLRQDREVLVCLDGNDPRLNLVPPAPYYEGVAIDFYARPVGSGLDEIIARLPDGCTLQRLDRELILRTQWGPDDVAWIGGLDAWENHCFGYCLMQDGEILCEATVGPAATGLREPGVITHEAHRGRGYATITSARLIQEIEDRGEDTYWNCAGQNLASAAVARKLGYRVERAFRVLAWSQKE